MRYLRWICWYLWEGLPALLAFPIDSSKPSVTGESWFSHSEDHWPRYVVGTFGFVVVAFTLAGCLCCRRQRCPKGFQEFKDGSTAGTETTIERHPSASLELEVPRLGSSSLSGKVRSDGPPIDRPSGVSVVKPKPPSPSLFSDEQEIESNFSREQPCREWFEPGNCHVPRERLKYLREIGRGWFGKVVEGTTESAEGSTRSRGVVVRILTEEATTREKAWFLGEATPYLKLQHPNIPTLLGSCLETDPYLLLFESCPAGDLKGFLRSNRDKGTCEALRSQNVPTRMALDIANALEHMHENGFAHTDLSARNCLVAPDLSAKLGDYGTGVEKYPGDYYVVGDRALPIRWSAPESLECTATTIETRAITPRANLWSYGVLLWEMATWGERPYDDLGDEQVIEMIFSLKTGFSSHGASALMLNKLRDERLEVPCNFREAIEASWKFFPDDRSSLADTRQIICGKRIEDFEKRWENLRPNGASLERDNRSASLQDLRVGGEPEGRDPSDLRAQFRLGPEEPVVNLPRGQHTGQESGSETEEESWRGRVERGAYTEKVKQKSKSVADLMVLVHIDSDSDAEISLGPQNVEKSAKKRLPASGSDGDLKSAVLADEFDEALRKLREPSVCNATSVRTSRSPLECSEKTENLEKPKLLTLTQQGETPILRLSFGNSESVGSSMNPEKIGIEDLSPLKNITKNLTTGIFDRDAADKISSTRQEERSSLDDILEKATAQAQAPRREDERVEDSERKSVSKNESPRAEGHLLRLVSKGDPDLPLLRYVPERASTPENTSIADQTSAFDSFLVFQPPQDSGLARFPNDFPAPRVVESAVDVALWNDALAFELEKKNPGYDADTTIFESFTNSTILDDREAGIVAAYLTDGGNDGTIERSASVPNTPSRRENFASQSSSAPDTPRNYHRADIDEDLANGSSSAAAYSVGILDEDSSTCEDLEASERILRGSAPDTPQSRGNYSVGNGDEDSSTCEELEASERILRGSAPDTPQSRGNYSVGNGDEDSSTGEELGMIKRSSHEAEDDDRKHLSTPDDERSSDSGFRDKESCEEEESPVPGTTASSIVVSGAISSSGFAANSSPLSASAEEEQMRILFELDTILDAEYYGSFHESENIDEGEVLSPSDVRVRLAEGEEIGAKNRSISESLGSTESTDIVETVRANSCEPDFLERTSRDVGQEEGERKVEDARVFGGKEEGKNSWEICDATETDSMSECSLRTDQNQSVDSSPLGLDSNKRRDSAVDPERNRGRDSESKLRGSDFDSAEMRGKIDGENDSADIEVRSSERSRQPENLEKSPRIGESDDAKKNRGPDSSSKLRGSDVDSAEMLGKIDGANGSADIEVRSPERSKHSENVEKSGEFPGIGESDDSEKNRGVDSSIELRRFNAESSDSRGEIDEHSGIELRSADRSSHPEKLEKSGESPIIRESVDSADLDPSTDHTMDSRQRDAPEIRGASEIVLTDGTTSKSTLETNVKSGPLEKSTESPMICKGEDSADSDSIIDLTANPRRTGASEILRASEIEFTNSTSRSPPGTDVKFAEIERSSGSEDLSSYRGTIDRSSENLEKPGKSEDSTTDLSTIYRSSENLEKPGVSENITTNLSKIYRSSENLEKPGVSEDSTTDRENLENPGVSENSTTNLSKIYQSSENLEKPCESENSTTDLSTIYRSSENFEKPTEASDVCEGSDVDLENSTSDSPLKTGCRRASDLSTETREADSLRSDGEQWSSRENVDENDDEEDSSTMSLRSDNSYVSFGLDEEFVAAIRNELREKLPRAQMPVVEALDPRDEKEPSINEDAETKRWEDEEAEDNSERGSGGVDISIRYNIYGTPLSPILEERESAGTSESLVSKEDSRDASIASRVSALSEDVLVVDTLTNRAMMLDGTASGNRESSTSHQDDDRDTSHGDFSDEENLEYPQNNLNRGMESKRIPMASGGAPLPSPEEETKWQQQFPLPLQMQDDLMSTSFGTDRDWDSQDEDEGDDDGEDGEEDEEENSSSSGEFVWKRYDESHGDLENVATRSPPNKPKCQEPEADLDEEDEGDEDDEEEEEEFTPSAWDATLAPHRSALRSPEKTPKSGDQKKSVWFKKQRYHCVYEYPKETPVAEGQGQAATTWEPTSYADWEEMMDEPRLDVYPMEYDETNRAGDEEFYVSSSNRPFQFQSGEGKYVSQFFPGASSTLLQQQQQQQPPASREGEDCQESQDEVDRADVPLSPPAQTNGNSRGVDSVDSQQQIQQSQLGELRHTRDRLKLNLLSTGGAAKAEEDIGNENRSQEVEGTEISEKETSHIPNNETEAPADDKSSRIPEELSKCEKLSELKIPKTEIVEDRSTKMAKSPENTSEEKRSLVPRKTIEIVEDSSRKSEKLPNDRSKDGSAERRMKKESSKSAKESEEGGKSIVAAIGEKSTSKEENVRSDFGGASSRPKNRDNLAVREASKEFFTKADGTRDALPSDYSAVIQGKDETDGAFEISSSNYNSRTIGDQKDSSNTRIVEATSDTVVAGQIVDITKLETEESPANARRHRVEGNSVIVEKSESTEVSSVPDASAVPSTIYSPDDKTHEDFVRSSQS